MNQGIWVFLIASLLASVIYMVRAYRKSMRQNKLILQQSKEIQKQNRELEYRNKLLQELNVEKQQIIGVVSHDLKGPFNRIFALMQLMSMSSENLTAEQKEYMGKIHQIVADGLNMVRNLLDNRKLEYQSGIDMHPEFLNISGVLNSLVKQYQPLASKKSILLWYDAPPLLQIQSDKLYLSRIFENLLSNAIKFSPRNKKVTVMATDLGNEIEISIEDEGPGINAEDQLKLYQKFQKLTAKPTGGESSTGLGLSIVKTMVEKMKGRVHYQSKDGKGAKFVVNLPK
ncbi:MAG: HAMP domain-containing sensor histidine kinase [Bacteroidota bacterium]